MLHIERLRMQLPEGFEHRAATIARLVGEAIADFQATENLSLGTLSISPVQVMPNATDWEIANSIAARIVSTLGART
jgi:hypothetical protein